MSGPGADPSSVTLLTLSFEGDLSLCRLLCETVDRFVPDGIPHVVAVPRTDMPRFADLANARRQVVAEEALLPSWLHKLPMPSREWRKRLRLPRRNIYLSTRGRPVRGWIAQQMMKLAAAAQVETELVLHVDSDTAFVRPLELESLWHDGKARLLRRLGHANLPTHQPWHRSASRLLGIPGADYHDADYIDNLVSWRRTNVRSLLAHLAATGGSEAAQLIAATPDFSEYILYGIYCDKVLGLEAAGHFADPLTLCETIWSLPTAAGSTLPAFALAPGQVAVAIQSTIPLSDAERRTVVAQATVTAA